MNKLKGMLFYASAIALSGAMVAQAHEETEGERKLGTVTVTATQRTESVEDVPIAVTALSSETLERAGIADIKSLDSAAPSVSMNSCNTEVGRHNAAPARRWHERQQYRSLKLGRRTRISRSDHGPLYWVTWRDLCRRKVSLGLQHIRLIEPSVQPSRSHIVRAYADQRAGVGHHPRRQL